MGDEKIDNTKFLEEKIIKNLYEYPIDSSETRYKKISIVKKKDKVT